MMGPVHEKLTRVRVNAMKNMLSRPVVLSAVASILLAHFEGSFMSNAPKKLMANIMRRMKNIMLQVALVARSLSFAGPHIAVTSMPRATYMTIIDRP